MSLFAVLPLSLLAWGGNFVAICCASALFASLFVAICFASALFANLGSGFYRYLLCFRYLCSLGAGILSLFAVLPLSFLAWGGVFVAVCCASAHFASLGRGFRRYL